MEGLDYNELACYRFKSASDMVIASRKNLESGEWKTAINRSYYAIFHAIRSVNILKGFDSSKHSGVIAFFTQNYIKTGLFDKKISKIIKNASYYREQSDYNDFYIASKTVAEEQLEHAVWVLGVVKSFLEMNGVNVNDMENEKEQ